MFIKLINLIFDLGNLYFIFLLSKKNLKTAFLYAINPVTILVTTLHGQFDVIPIFFVLLSIYLLGLKKEILSMFVYSLSIMIKTWPVLFIFLFLKKLKNKWLILLVIIFPIISIFIYSILFKSSLINIIKTIANYHGLWGIWGMWSLFGKWRLRWQKLSTLIFLACFFVCSFFDKKRNIVKNILNLLFLFFIFTPNFSIQYFAWIIPFLIIVKPKKCLLLTSFMTLTLISHYATPNLIIIQELTQFTTWILFIHSLKVNELTEARD